MQANCPNCQHKIVIDDARVPDRPFSVKCPKCKNALRFPGKGANEAAAASAPAPAASEAPSAPAPAAPAPPAPSSSVDMTLPGRPRDASPDSVYTLVALPDSGQAGQITLTLSRLGHHVDTLENWEDASRLLDTATFDVVVTSHSAKASGGYSPYQKMVRMPLETRRRICLISVGDDVQTGDGSTAFRLQADMVLNSSELATATMPIREVLFERERVYQAYFDALVRVENET